MIEPDYDPPVVAGAGTLPVTVRLNGNPGTDFEVRTPGPHWVDGGFASLEIRTEGGSEAFFVLVMEAPGDIVTRAPDLSSAVSAEGGMLRVQPLVYSLANGGQYQQLRSDENNGLWVEKAPRTLVIASAAIGAAETITNGAHWIGSSGHVTSQPASFDVTAYDLLLMAWVPTSTTGGTSPTFVPKLQLTYDWGGSGRNFAVQAGDGSDNGLNTAELYTAVVGTGIANESTARHTAKGVRFPFARLAYTITGTPTTLVGTLYLYGLRHT